MEGLPLVDMVLDAVFERSRTEREAVVRAVAHMQSRLDALRVKLAKEAPPNKCSLCGYEMGRCVTCDAALASAADPRCYACEPDMYPRIDGNDVSSVSGGPYYFRDCCRRCGAATCGLERSL